MKRQVGNLRDLAVKLPLRDAFVLSQAKATPPSVICSPNCKDQASGEKKPIFFLTKMKYEFQPFLYQQGRNQK